MKWHAINIGMFFKTTSRTCRPFFKLNVTMYVGVLLRIVMLTHYLTSKVHRLPRILNGQRAEAPSIQQRKQQVLSAANSVNTDISVPAKELAFSK